MYICRLTIKKQTYWYKITSEINSINQIKQMKNLIKFLPIILIAQFSNAQDRVITTGVPFLLIAADARSAGMADMGVATSADAYSQQYNP